MRACNKHGEREGSVPGRLPIFWPHDYGRGTRPSRGKFAVMDEGGVAVITGGTRGSRKSGIARSCKNPVSRVADLWLCGTHPVLCGDATLPEDVARLLGDRNPILMVPTRRPVLGTFGDFQFCIGQAGEPPNVTAGTSHESVISVGVN
jgi:hypothetical protein